MITVKCSKPEAMEEPHLICWRLECQDWNQAIRAAVPKPPLHQVCSECWCKLWVVYCQHSWMQISRKACLGLVPMFSEQRVRIWSGRLGKRLCRPLKTCRIASTYFGIQKALMLSKTTWNIHGILRMKSGPRVWKARRIWPASRDCREDGDLGDSGDPLRPLS